MGGLAAQGAVACLCLLTVLGLILGAGRIARHIPGLLPTSQPGSPLSVLATATLDRSHRAYLLAAEGHHVLVLTGAGQVAITLLAPEAE